MKKIFISAGDYSGDVHASYLVKELQKHTEYLQISAIGGYFLEEIQNIVFLENIVNKQMFGFRGLITKYVYLKNLLNNKIIPHLKNESVDLVILVDFYGFNIHLAKQCKNLGIKVIHYISPQIWASRKNRIFKIKKWTDLVIPILPFEESLYQEIGVKTFYQGNPLVDIIDLKMNEESDFEINDKAIALMPGSRESEIKNLLPIFLQILRKTDFKNEVFLILAKSIKNDEIILMLEEFKDKIKIVDGPAYSLRKKVRFILMSSGTATLENAILGAPMMIFYKLDKISYFIAKLIVKIKFIGMPNILADKMIMPEYVQNMDYEKIKNEFCLWLEDDALIAEKQDELKKIKGKLKPVEHSILENISKYILNGDY